MSARGQGRFRRTWERVRSEPQLGRNVATLVALIVLASIAGGIILSNQRFEWPWEDPFAFSATFEEAPAVSPGHGQEVRIAGVSVGEIRAAGLSDSGNAELELAIDRKHKVYENARVVLRPKSPLNEMYVELDPGGPPGKELTEGAVLPVGNSRRPIQIDEVLGHLDDNARAALTTLVNESDAALAGADTALAPGLTATDRVVRELQPVVAALHERKDKLARLVSALSQVSTSIGGDDKRLSELATSLQRTLGVVGDQNDPLNSALDQLPDLATQLKRATDSVRSMSDELDPTLDNLRRASGTLPGSLAELDETVRRVGDTVDVAKPVVERARPVVSDLRPLVSDVRAALPHLRDVSTRLDPITGGLVPYLNDLGAFVYNTNSAASLQDANGGILRGLLQFGPSTVPLEQLESLAGQQPDPK
ncbi:MAG: MlaD family protein [Thermocrispum sp.]